MLVNLTPHEIQIVIGTGAYGVHTIPPSGQIARCVVKTVPAGMIGALGFPLRDGKWNDDPVAWLSRQEFGAVEGLPEPKEGVWYIVSTLVAQQAKRADVVSPDTGPTAIRENGQVKAVLGFQSFA